MNNKFQPVLLGCLASVIFSFQIPFMAYAAELKVVDATGLVRSAKVVQDDGDIEVTLGGAVQGEVLCTLKNVDGLAPDKTTHASAARTCVFSGVPAGTWQLSTSKSSKWQVRITGDR